MSSRGGTGNQKSISSYPLSALLSLSIATLACSSHKVGTTPVEPPVKQESMSLVGRYGFAHACPVDGQIVTAAHVAEAVSKGSTYRLYYTYVQGDKAGYLSPGWVAQSRDIALLSVDAGDAPAFNKTAEKAPHEGDDIYWYEFEYSRGASIKKKEGRVIGVTGGHMAFYPPPHPGASGGCILNENGDVLGIVTWGIEGTKMIGFGPILTGHWRPW